MASDGESWSLEETGTKKDLLGKDDPHIVQISTKRSYAAVVVGREIAPPVSLKDIGRIENERIKSDDIKHLVNAKAVSQEEADTRARQEGGGWKTVKPTKKRQPKATKEPLPFKKHKNFILRNANKKIIPNKAIKDDIVVKPSTVTITPTLTWVTSPHNAIHINDDGHGNAQKAAVCNSLECIGLELESGASVKGKPMNEVFIGNCTSGGEDICEVVTSIAIRHKVGKDAHVMNVPCSGLVEHQAPSHKTLGEEDGASAAAGREEKSCQLLGLVSKDGEDWTFEVSGTKEDLHEDGLYHIFQMVGKGGDHLDPDLEGDAGKDLDCSTKVVAVDGHTTSVSKESMARISNGGKLVQNVVESMLLEKESNRGNGSKDNVQKETRRKVNGVTHGIFKFAVAALGTCLLPRCVLAIPDHKEKQPIFPTKTHDIDNSKGNSRVFIKFAHDKRESVAKALRATGGAFHYGFDMIDTLNTFVVSLPTKMLDSLTNISGIDLIEEDPIRYLGPIVTATNDNELFHRRRATHGQTVPYGIDMVEARDVWDVDRDGVVDEGAPTGSNKTICIIDTGLKLSHEDLQGISATGYDVNAALPWNQDSTGHGTHVAGIIAAVNNHLGVVGVTPGTASLHIIRVFDESGKFYSSDLVDAARQCANAGANIISVSVGGYTPSQTESNFFGNLTAQGILSIAAAGNTGNDQVEYPAAYPSVVSVGAIDSKKVVASFSKRNSHVDVVAPGVDILSTYANPEPSNYFYLSGTSLACPHVAAVAALVWSAKPSATNEEVLTAITATAEDLGFPGRDDFYGHGLVRAKKAIDYILSGTATPTATPAPTASAELYTGEISFALSTGFVRQFYIETNANEILTCSTESADGDADIYMKIGSMADTTITENNDCISVTTNFNPSCSVFVMGPTRVYAAVKAFTSFTNANFKCLSATMQEASSPISGISSFNGVSKYYYIDTLAGGVVCSTSGGNGDANLYMKVGAPPDSNNNDYDCGSNNSGSNEICSVQVLGATTTRVYIQVNAPSRGDGFSDLTLTCSVISFQQYTSPITNMALSQYIIKGYYIDTDVNKRVVCSTSGGNGDANLYMKVGQDYDCISDSLDSSNEICSVQVLGATTTRVYIQVHAFEAFSDLTLTCSVISPQKYTSPITNMALSQYIIKDYYMDITAGMGISCWTTGPNGDADLYMKIGSIASPDYSDCSSTNFDTSYETCSIGPALNSTRVYVAVLAVQAFSSLTLRCNRLTSNPTSKPTRIPTSKPTRRPTLTPTSKPTSRPTSKPTRWPTIKPTSKPTRRPTFKPTSKPSRRPN
ncbi:hypothetical protein ACHAXA_011490 [Cyclostephanos tholiformis]|uniref:subtilisin n=1 Tax=Cyclostephanos tholiformis TaxID=382380 RepID=A0ABD3R3U1_9STRA